MKIYELRKTVSKNKKYKYVYQLIVNDETPIIRRSNKEYVAVWFEETKNGTRYHWVRHAASISTVFGFTVALTFDELVKFKNLSV
jgi:hypothetical protein